MNSVIHLSHIGKIYAHVSPHVHALTDVDLTIEQGEFFCFVGPSGCGKSTLLKILAGIEQPSFGEMKVNGKISMAFQSGALLPWLTVEENIDFASNMAAFSTEKVKAQTQKYLELVNLEQFRHKYPRELSGGQRQRVGLARALSVEPEILLLDEPFSALDPLTTDELHKYILQIWQQTKTTIVMVSHILEEAVYLSDRIGIMKEGKLHEILKVELKRPRNPETKEFLKIVDKIKADFSL